MPRKCAASVTGLQEPPTWLHSEHRSRKIWVLNGDVQLDDNGMPVSLDESPYIWLGEVCGSRPELLQPEPITGHLRIADPTKKSCVSLPLNEYAAVDLIDILDRYYAHNLPAVLLIIGGFIVCVHYESMIEQHGSVPATIAYGPIQCGKSKATRVALSLMGVSAPNFFTNISDCKAFEYTSQTTLGMVLDDPEDLKQVSKKLTYHFQKSSAATKMYCYKPRTTFITSMNEHMLLKIAAHSR